MLGLSVVTRNHEDVSDFVIGSFGDKRLCAIGGLLFKRLCSKLTVCIKNLAETRALEVGIGRFLHNENVSITEMEHALVEKTNHNCIGLPHVLGISDTVENTFPGQRIKKSNFGYTSEKCTKGFFGHPVIMVDANSKDILGIGSIQAWNRSEETLAPIRTRLIEDKESFKWIKAAQNTFKNITNPAKITMVYDREGDIYELFDRVPNDKIELLVRTSHNRRLVDGIFLSEHMDNIIENSEYKIELPSITGKRTARIATMRLKFSKVIMPKAKDIKINFKHTQIEVTCVEATEISEPPAGEKPIYWRILTTHKVTTAQAALQIVVWYTWRWTIEQIFRTLKTKGLGIENSQIEEPKALLKLFVLGIAAAVKVMCLVHARDGVTNRPASHMFSEMETVVLSQLLIKLQGKTIKQQNPFRKNSLSWASWIIARLGGWTGYRHKTASPPGPITMHKGLSTFDNYVQAWKLFQNVNVVV